MGEVYKWYQSKKFITVLVALLSLLVNDYLGLNLSEMELTSIVGLAIAFITAQTTLDYKDRKNLKTALQDPILRDALEALVEDAYDYSLAKDGNITAHSVEVKEKVLAGLEIILDPKFLKESQEISQEIIRLIMKLYKEDQNMSKGANVVIKSQQLDSRRTEN